LSGLEFTNRFSLPLKETASLAGLQKKIRENEIAGKINTWCTMYGQLAYLAAASFLASPFVDAKALKWQQDEPTWSPAHPTLPAMELFNQLAPQPTEAPDASHILGKRAERDRTCGFINGIDGESHGPQLARPSFLSQ
jgi:hypothetical protein